MWFSHNSAHSCLDTSMDGYTDPCPAVKILLIFCENSFSNICLEKEKWNIVFFSLMTKQKLKTLTNVWEDLYSLSSGITSCLLACWRVYEPSTWQHIKAESTGVDLTTGEERQSWSPPIGQEDQSTSGQSRYICTLVSGPSTYVCAGTLTHMCVSMGALGGVWK